MWLPTKAQIDAASRHVITAAGVAVTIFGLQAKGVDMNNVKALIESFGNTANTVIQLIAAIGVVYGGIKAANSASPVNQIAHVQEIATGPSSPVAEDAQKALIAATSAVAQDNSIPKSQDAKVALLDATASLDEVQKPIEVSDPALAAATTSPLVKAA